MKILFSIFLFKNSTGGHFYSLKTIANELSKQEGYEVHVLVIGFEKTDLFSDNIKLKVHTCLIDRNLFSLIKSFIYLYKLAGRYNYNVFHAFDQVSFFWMRIISNFKNVKLFLNKCGGPVNRWYPKCKNTVVFTIEDYEFFNNNKKFKKNTYHLIPNRITRIVEDNKRIKRLKEKYPQKIEFVKIVRFSDLHKNSIIQAINFINRLNGTGINCRLLIIGKIENIDILNAILKLSNENILIETDDFFTKEASRLIYYFKYVIGSGRSLMEGAACSKVIFSSNSSLDIPIVINRQNWNDFFYYNFSSRSIFRNLSEEKVLIEVSNIIKSAELYNKYSMFSFDLFTNYFDVSTGIKRYINIYNLEAKYDLNLYDNLIQFSRIMYKLLFK